MTHGDGAPGDGTATPGAPGDGTATPIPWLDDGRPLRVLAPIWATVELERALGDLGPVPDGASAAALVDGAVEDPLLGARVIVVPSDVDGLWIALAEPSTEGRLAATLVRNGEGPAGRYVLAPFGLAVVKARAAAAGVLVSSPAGGPFGSAILVLGGPIAGPHLILVDPAAVPSRP